MVPYELYVRFLVTKGLDLEQVNEQLKTLTLKPISQKDFDRNYELVHSMLPAPVSKQVVDQKPEGDFFKWMIVLEVNELWEFEPKYRIPERLPYKLAIDVNYDPQLRISIFALLIKGIQSDDIAQTLNLRFSCMLKKEHVSFYEKYFCNARRMTRGHWRAYLSSSDERERAILFTALTEDLDTLKTALELPSKAHISDALQFLFTNSYQKAKHYLRLTTPDANKEARAWINQTVQLADKYEKYRTGDAEDFSKTLQMEFEYISSDFQTPDEATLVDLKKRTAAKEGENE